MDLNINNNDDNNNNNWQHSQSFTEDYYLHGRWRLTFAMSFVSQLQYKYCMQMDDDTFLMNAIDFNIVTYFNEHDIKMGVRRRYIVEKEAILSGLPEFTK